MTKYINGHVFKESAGPHEEPEVDVLASLQLALANGHGLAFVLQQYAEHLADRLEDRADDWVDQGDPLNNALITGLKLAADQIRQVEL